MCQVQKVWEKYKENQVMIWRIKGKEEEEDMEEKEEEIEEEEEEKNM